MIKKIRLPVEIIIYFIILNYYAEFIVSREVQDYVLWPSTILVLLLTWYIFNKIFKQLTKQK